ncbi:MAG: phosphoribosylaminoimidazolesuccinocarboxamide synthase [Adlercreutzia equolifaciens]
MAGIDITPDAGQKVRDLVRFGRQAAACGHRPHFSAFRLHSGGRNPYKGQVLTQLSKFWFELLDGVVENHLISTDVADLPDEFQPYADYLRGRFMLVKKADMFPAECIVRGYLATGSWPEGVSEPRGHRTAASSCPRAW